MDRRAFFAGLRQRGATASDALLDRTLGGTLGGGLSRAEEKQP
jgi:hypothetical protein